MDRKIPKYTSEERSRREEEKARKDEKERAKLKRKAGVNYGLDNTAMKKAGLFPLSRRQLDKATKNGLQKEAQSEQARRREGWRVAAQAGAVYLEQYLGTVKDTGLKDQASLKLRLELLWKSVNKDSQVLAISHLAKTLAMTGELDQASKQMGAWRRKVAPKTVEDITRWKKASLCLELYMTQKRSSSNSLSSDQWKAGRKAKVTKEEVEEITRQAQDNGYLYLFDQADEDLFKPSGTPSPRTSMDVVWRMHV